ncbi:heavy metal sensor histidine kinase [Serratia proteamaculans]|uniref:heavy metal sensor histidine kinase n=1 Tax=Serratia proteamaculans TaxID=28151 RepID=UPI002179C417|nr:heavy metal sensor histidine kinase [Serratia proteamaculans]CAI1625977.1 Sensor kinase CusS [Serratia proteamaculans]CAI1657920.1 Sensor kinase CusS [Serratia proteamaculans]CAI1698023.1 Sensor kinase CusS [Serratia proteamaculans]
MKVSISSRMALMFALTMALIMLVLALFLRSSLLTSLQNQMHNELHFRHSLISPFIEAKGTARDWPMVQQKLNTLSNSEGNQVKYWVISNDPRYRIGGPPPAGTHWSKLPDGFATAPDPQGGCPLYMLIATLPPLGDRPEVRYVVAIDSTPYMGTLNEFTRALVIISLLGIGLAAMLGYAISRIGMRPVLNLSEQAHSLVPGTSGQRLDSAALPAELRNLAESFNGVLARQEIAWRQLESFNADVAHELRTPLTNLIGQTQLALARERGVHELEELLQSNLEELDRMTSIVNDMLFLSHAQAGQYATQLSEVSLREESLKTAEYVEPSFMEKDLVIEISGEVRAQVDRRLFHRALANLLENSARHAATGSAVSVRLQEQRGFAVVAVANQGETIAPEHLTRLFERFYRVDSSRVRSDMHHGLGLSIVRAIALMHHGEAFVRSVDGVNTFGFSLALSLPEEHPITPTSEPVQASPAIGKIKRESLS